MEVRAGMLNIYTGGKTCPGLRSMIFLQAVDRLEIWSSWESVNEPAHASSHGQAPLAPEMLKKGIGY